jgi:uncharacterized protein YwbE
MREYSDDNEMNYDWYKLENTILGVREKKSGGFSVKINYFDFENISSFKNLLLKILEYYKYQFITFDTRSIKDIHKKIIEKELRSIGFGSYQSHNMVFQEKPRKGDVVLIAIKPYIGRYEKGNVLRVLTGAMYHPRGFKVMLNDKDNTVGRIATIRKKGHKQ